MAREQGLSEQTVAEITDGYDGQSVLTDDDKAALHFVDALIGDPRSFTDAQKAAILHYFTPAQVVELAVGVTLFLSLSKVLIILGLEPEGMPTTVVPTPGTWSNH